MKQNKFLIFFLLFSLIFITSCDKEQDDLVTANAVEGGLVDPVNSSMNYVVGSTGTYESRLKVYQGEVKTSSIDVYKQFKGAAGTTANVLWKTLTVSNQETHILSYTFDYNELRQGLTFANGSEIPADDTQLNIGDTWVLTYVSHTSTGKSHTNSSTTASTSVAVSTRLAGTYEVIASTYWRLGVDNGGWNGSTRIIKSVNSTTYLHEGFGPFEFADFGDEAKFYFVVNSENKTSYPAEFEGFTVTGRGDYLITCESNPNDMANAPCGDASNYVMLDDVNGEDILYLSYGYYIDGSGPREFYEVLKKIVD
ncbi:MAG: hypothetical protein IPL35_13505 [Sphingobacteriales bacterium]|nr:hypothetical protein [Sphingobacteriales bacterium]